MSLENIGKKLAISQIKKPAIFFIALGILLILFLPGLPLLLNNVEPSLEKILPQEVQEVKVMNDMRAQFGADMMYIIITADGPSYDVRAPDVLKYIDILSSKLIDHNMILEINNLPNLVKEINNDVIPESKQEVKNLLALNPRTPMYINNDYSLTIIQIRSDTGATSSTIKEVVDYINAEINAAEAYNPGVSLELTGFNAIDKATFEVIIADFQYITGFTFVFMLAFLFLYFRSWRKVLGAMSVIMISVLVTLGITGYLGITVTVITMVAAAMIMALGISYGINITYDYYLIRKEKNKFEALQELNSNLIRALVGSSLTTSAGFLALLFGIIPAMKNLGIVLAIGIVVTLIVSIVFLPVIMFRLDKEDSKSNKKNK